MKRAIGVPGDHIKLVNKKLWLNGHFVEEPYVVHSSTNMDSYRDNFPGGPQLSAADAGHRHVGEPCGEW